MKMMKDTYNVAVLIFSENCFSKVHKSIQSALAQDFDPRRIKIAVVDNASTDDSYERLLGLAASNPIAVYRMRKTYLPAQLLRRSLRILKYFDWRYMTILNPGDVIYPDYVATCSRVMDTNPDFDRKALFCEAHVIGAGGEVVAQKPVFADNCILRKREHYTQFFMHGTGHKIQAFFAEKAFSRHLSDLVFCADYSDWFYKAMLAFNTDCIYLQKVLAGIALREDTDLLEDLVLRLYLVKRLDLIRGTVFADMAYGCLDEVPSEQVISQNLSKLALHHAGQALCSGASETAQKILLFAEMVNEQIVDTPLFAQLEQSLRDGGDVGDPGLFRITEKTVPPPAFSLPLNAGA